MLVDLKKGKEGKSAFFLFCTFKATLSSFSHFGAIIEKMRGIGWEKNILRDRHVSN
jgi:hypothetical protein